MSTESVWKIWRDRPITYWTYYVAGGMYTSDEFSKHVKILWFALNAFNICALASCAIGYLVTLNTLTLTNLIIIFAIHSGSIISQIFIPLVLLYCKSDITELLKYIAENTSEGTKSRVNKSKLLSIKRVELFPTEMMLGIVFGISLYVLAPFLDFAFNYDEKVFGRIVEHHNLGVPYMHCLSSISLYWAVYLCETVIITVPLIIIFSEVLLMETITRGLNNVIFNFCGRFQRLSSLFEGKMGPLDVSPEELYYFEKKLASLIAEYQVFIKKTNLLRPYVVIISACVLPTLFSFTTFQLFTLFLGDFSYALKIKFLTATLLGQLHMYPYCSFGSANEEMRDEIAYQVYNLPWYCLPPRRRKDVYILWTQGQHFVPVKIFNVFPVNKIFFPKIVRLSYSYVSVLVAVIKSNY